jgi:hypothetical protein
MVPSWIQPMSATDRVLLSEVASKQTQLIGLRCPDHRVCPDCFVKLGAASVDELRTDLPTADPQLLHILIHSLKYCP